MENVLLVISLLSCVALIGAVLLQRSEGGALGMGGGGGGLVSGRGAADTLVRLTMVLAAVFFVTCLALTRIAADKARDDSDVIRTIEEIEPDAAPVAATGPASTADGADAPTTSSDETSGGSALPSAAEEASPSVSSASDSDAVEPKIPEVAAPEPAHTKN